MENNNIRHKLKKILILAHEVYTVGLLPNSDIGIIEKNGDYSFSQDLIVLDYIAKFLHLNKHLNIKYVIHDNKLNIVALILVDDDNNDLYIVWRGTISLNNWYNDFQIGLVNWKNYTGKFHRGFVADMLNIDTSLAFWSGIKDLIKPNTKIFVTGHSLGGPLAYLFLLLLYTKILHNSNLNVEIEVYTYGAPRFCNADGILNFENLYHSQSKDIQMYENYNVVLYRDPVPQGVNVSSWWNWVYLPWLKYIMPKPEYMTYGSKDNNYYELTLGIPYLKKGDIVKKPTNQEYRCFLLGFPYNIALHMPILYDAVL
jgi:hypothetical protein